MRYHQCVTSNLLLEEEAQHQVKQSPADVCEESHH